MRQAKVLFKNEEAGILTQLENGAFTFGYSSSWLNNNQKPAISLTMPKKEGLFQSEYLFPFFFNMLPEGSNKQLACKYNRIDQDDYFGLLIYTAQNDTIGAVNLQKIDIQ